MPASEKRIAANRANSMKSTGPRTPEGKAKSKMNAVTHGLSAQASVLPGESRGQLEELSAELMRELKPDGVVQRLIAERVVSLAWKLRRAARAEEVVAHEMEAAAQRSWERGDNLATQVPVFRQFVRERPGRRNGPTLLADAMREGAGAKDGRLVRITQYELKLDAALRAAVRELRALQKQQRRDEDADDAEPEAAVETAGETPAAQNEAKAERDDESDASISNLKSEIADPTPEPSAAEPAGDKTNPTPPGDAAAQPPAATGFPGESSAPAPRTSSSPHPGPRR